MSHDPHFGFVIAAYALAFFVIGGMIAAILLDSFRLRRALSSFAPPADHRHAQGGSASQEAAPQASDSEGSD
jgi:heme exporter protein CcmD